MAPANELTSAPLTPDEARDLVLDLERTGVDTGRIHVDSAPPTNRATTGQVDQATVTRPALRAGLGLIAGALLGLLIGLAVAAIGDTALGPTLLATIVGAGLVGALTGLYVRLPVNTEVSDVATGTRSTVRVDIAGLAESDVSDIEQNLARR